MKKLALILTTAVIIGMVSTAAFAQPFTPTVASDSYGIAQGSGNILSVPTPRDNNDNSGGVPNRADINDAINLLLGTSYARNSSVDFLQWTAGDKTWKDLSTSNNTGTYVAISLTAGNTNTLNVHDVATPLTLIPVLPGLTGFGYTGFGTSTDPFLAGFSPFTGGTNFGWALTSVNGTSKTWYSDPALNADLLDHMLTYDLSALAGSSVWIKHSCGVDPIDVNDGSTDFSGCTEEEYTFKKPFLITWEDLGLANGKLGDEDYDDMIFLVDRVIPNTPEPATMALMASGLLGFAGLRRKRS